MNTVSAEGCSSTNVSTSGLAADSCTISVDPSASFTWYPRTGEKCPCCGEQWKRRKGDKVKGAKKAKPKRRKTGK